MRRTLIITAIVFVLTGVGIVLYFYLFNNAPNVSVTPAGSSGFPVAGQGTLGTGTTGTSTTTSVSNTTPSQGTPITVSARLVRINKGPVVPGEVVTYNKSISASSSPEIAVTYIERQSGNVFTYLTKTKNFIRTSNKTVPGIESAAWLPNGSFAFVRYLSGANFSTINTFALPSNGTGGFFLPQNLNEVAVSSTSVLTLASGVNGSTASLSRTDGTHSVTVFTTPLSSLRVSFAGKQYLAFTKPSSSLLGDAFIVDAAGHFSRIAGPHNGLVALASPSGKWVLASYTLGTSMQMELVNTTTGETLALPVATIADKCVWSADDSSIYCGVPVEPPPNIAYPDDWYQGAVSFTDRIWKIQVAGRYAQLVLDFSKETKGSLDVESPTIDLASTVLVFVNKNDGSLWSYSL